MHKDGGAWVQPHTSQKGKLRPRGGGKEVIYPKFHQNVTQVPFLEAPIFPMHQLFLPVLWQLLKPFPPRPPPKSCWQQLAEPSWPRSLAGVSLFAQPPLWDSLKTVSPDTALPAGLPQMTVPCAPAPPFPGTVGLAFLQGLFLEWKKESRAIDVKWLLCNGGILMRIV